MTSAVVTVAESLITTPSVISIEAVSPCKVVAIIVLKSVDGTSPSMTWYVKIADNAPLLSGNNKHSNKPSGRAANASSVGASTVNGPFGSARGLTKSAAVNPATNVSKEPAAIAVDGISTGLDVWLSAFVLTAVKQIVAIAAKANESCILIIVKSIIYLMLFVIVCYWLCSDFVLWDKL